MEFTFYPLVVIIQYVPGYIFSDSVAMTNFMCNKTKKVELKQRILKII